MLPPAICPAGRWPEPFLERRPVRRPQRIVESPLLPGIAPLDGASQLALDGGHRLHHAPSPVAASIAIPQLPGLMTAGGSARRHGRLAALAALQLDLHLQRGMPPRIQDLPGRHMANTRFHERSVLLKSECPVISGGIGNPMSSSKVGATSARMPSASAAPERELSTSIAGTGLEV